MSESGTHKALFLSLDGGTTYKVVANETECSYNPSSEERETTSKTSGDWSDFETTKKGYEITVNALYTANDATYHNSTDVQQAIGDTVSWRLDVVDSAMSPVSGEERIEGTALLKDPQSTHPDKDNATLSFTLKGKQAPTFTTVPV